MKHLLLTLFLLASVSLWAQRGRIPVADKSKEIPMKPVVVEGELTSIADGTPVQLGFRINKTNGFQTANNTLVDTIRNGKFRIEKKYLYKDFEEEDDNVSYSLIVEGIALPIFAYPGATVKVSGTPSMRMDVQTWKAESDHPLHKEFYDYVAYQQEVLSPIRKKIQAAYEEDDVDDDLIKRLEREKDSVNVVSLIDYMKDKKCNFVFTENLMHIAFLANKLGSKGLKDRIRNTLLPKIPAGYDDRYLMFARQDLSIYEPLQSGEQAKDFVLYDRKGKEHKSSEFRGKYTVLEFTSVTCGPCLQVMPILDGFYKRNKGKVEVVAISVDPEEIWMKENNNVSFHEWNDHKCAVDIAAQYKTKGTPAFVILDPDGKFLNLSHGAKSFFTEMMKYVPDAEIEKELK